MTREEAIKHIKIHMLIHRMAEDRAVYITEALNMAIEALRQPEIIQCKNCEHNESPSTAGNACCNKFYGMTDQTGFCHYGERRTDE